MSASTGTVTFSNGQGSAQASIPIQGSGFLQLGSTFSVTLLDVQFLGAGGKVLIISHSPRAQTLWCAAAGRISSCCSRREESRDTHHSMETQAGRDREGAAIVVYIAGGGRLGGMSSEFSRGKLCASPLHTHARAPSLLPS